MKFLYFALSSHMVDDAYAVVEVSSVFSFIFTFSARSFSLPGS